MNSRISTALPESSSRKAAGWSAARQKQDRDRVHYQGSGFKPNQVLRQTAHKR
jgi:hypothetical protein